MDRILEQDGVAQDFLDVLGVQPVLGRNFMQEEGVWGGRITVILTHGFWMRRFGADSQIIGASISIDSELAVVVGILPRSFDFSSTFTPHSRVDFLEPFPISEDLNYWGKSLALIGRLKPGITLKSAGDDTKGQLGLKRAEATIIDGGGKAGQGPGIAMAEGATLDGFTRT